MQIHNECYGTIAVSWLLCLVAIGLCLLIPWKWLSILLILYFVQLMFFVVWFHRIPERTPAGTDKLVTAVADGEIVIVERVYEPEFLQSDCIQVSIYMRFFNVHANFFPVDGQVVYAKYHPLAHVMAFKPKASELNEHSSIGIENAHGKVFFKQIAGFFARRIVFHADPGQEVKAGSLLGIIKFGSRIDMFFPLDADIKVKIGDRTRAAETVIAELA